MTHMLVLENSLLLLILRQNLETGSFIVGKKGATCSDVQASLLQLYETNTSSS